MGINVVERIDDNVRIHRVLVSVSDKRDLENLIPGMLRLNPDIRFFRPAEPLPG